jgi:hypothetical protein
VCGGGGAGTCRACGGLGERCCPGANRDYCGAPYVCNGGGGGGGMCELCGGAGQLCCPGRVCKTGSCGGTGRCP